MTTREEAIAWFNAQGRYAFEMDNYARGAFFVATRAVEDDLGFPELKGRLVALCPRDGNWVLEPVPAMRLGPIFEPLSFVSLDAAVGTARTLMTV